MCPKKGKENEKKESLEWDGILPKLVKGGKGITRRPQYKLSSFEAKFTIVMYHLGMKVINHDIRIKLDKIKTKNLKKRPPSTPHEREYSSCRHRDKERSPHRERKQERSPPYDERHDDQLHEKRKEDETESHIKGRWSQ